MSQTLSLNEEQMKYIFQDLRKWAKHSMNRNSHFSATQYMMDGAEKLFNKIEETKILKISYQEKVRVLYEFLKNEDVKEQKNRCSSDFYHNSLRFILKNLDNIEEGKPLIRYYVKK